MADERTEWIGTSQYHKAKEYKEPKTLEDIKCKFSHVMPSTEITYKSIQHAGIVTHKCFLLEKHEDECICLCGDKFKGWE